MNADLCCKNALSSQKTRKVLYEYCQFTKEDLEFKVFSVVSVNKTCVLPALVQTESTWGKNLNFGDSLRHTDDRSHSIYSDKMIHLCASESWVNFFLCVNLFTTQTESLSQYDTSLQFPWPEFADVADIVMDLLYLINGCFSLPPIQPIHQRANKI